MDMAPIWTSTSTSYYYYNSTNTMTTEESTELPFFLPPFIRYG